MGMTKVVHYTCDRKGCTKHGTAKAIPNDWKYMQIFQPHHTPPGTKVPRATALLCPECANVVSGMVILLTKDGEDVPTETKD